MLLLDFRKEKKEAAAAATKEGDRSESKEKKR